MGTSPSTSTDGTTSTTPTDVRPGRDSLRTPVRKGDPERRSGGAFLFCPGAEPTKLVTASSLYALAAVVRGVSPR
jgi:hypothetical protein